MLEYNMIAFCKKLSTNKTKQSRRCVFCKYYNFLNVNLRFQPKACDICHELILKDMSFNKDEILFVKGNFIAVNTYLYWKIEILIKYRYLL